MRTDAADLRKEARAEGNSRRERSRRLSAYLWLRTIFRWILAAGVFLFRLSLGSFCWAFSWIRGRTTRRSAGYRALWCGWRERAWRFGARRDSIPSSVCFFVSNHVNLFDPFVLYCAMPQFIRGLELESHFRIPVYGWLMKRFGNVPVPDVNRPSDLKRMWRLTRAALERGVSLVVFPEGSRTITGRVGPFHDGVFRMAQDFGTPITPVSIVGSFTFQSQNELDAAARRRSWCGCTTPSTQAGTAKRKCRSCASASGERWLGRFTPRWAKLRQGAANAPEEAKA